MTINTRLDSFEFFYTDFEVITLKFYTFVFQLNHLERNIIQGQTLPKLTINGIEYQTYRTDKVWKADGIININNPSWRYYNIHVTSTYYAEIQGVEKTYYPRGIEPFETLLIEFVEEASKIVVKMKYDVDLITNDIIRKELISYAATHANVSRRKKKAGARPANRPKMDDDEAVQLVMSGISRTQVYNDLYPINEDDLKLNEILERNLHRKKWGIRVGKKIKAILER